MTGPVTPVEAYLSRIATAVERLVAIAEGVPSPDPGTAAPAPTVSKASAPRKTAPAKGAKTTVSRKGR